MEDDVGEIVGTPVKTPCRMRVHRKILDKENDFVGRWRRSVLFKDE